ncbi:hypothetical protein ABK040_005009 [Willaertia magna]
MSTATHDGTSLLATTNNNKPCRYFSLSEIISFCLKIDKDRIPQTIQKQLQNYSDNNNKNNKQTISTEIVKNVINNLDSKLFTSIPIIDKYQLYQLIERIYHLNENINNNSQQINDINDSHENDQNNDQNNNTELYQSLFWSPSGGTSGKFDLFFPSDIQENQFMRIQFSKLLLKLNIFNKETIALNLFSGSGMYRSKELFVEFIQNCNGTSIPCGFDWPDEIILQWILKFKVNTLCGSPTRLIQLANYYVTKYLQQQQFPNTRKITIKDIMYAQEEMQLEKLRYLRKVFKIERVASIYGSAETGVYAAQPYQRVLDFISDDSSDNCGEEVLSLNNENDENKKVKEQKEEEEEQKKKVWRKVFYYDPKMMCVEIVKTKDLNNSCFNNENLDSNSTTDHCNVKLEKELQQQEVEEEDLTGGHIIVTNLVRSKLPLLRYNTGDVGRKVKLENSELEAIELLGRDSQSFSIGGDYYYVKDIDIKLEGKVLATQYELNQNNDKEGFDSLTITSVVLLNNDLIDEVVVDNKSNNVIEMNKVRKEKEEEVKKIIEKFFISPEDDNTFELIINFKEGVEELKRDKQSHKFRKIIDYRK